jgi:hypothetical protein
MIINLIIDAIFRQNACKHINRSLFNYCFFDMFRKTQHSHLWYNRVTWDMFIFNRFVSLSNIYIHVHLFKLPITTTVCHTFCSLTSSVIKNYNVFIVYKYCNCSIKLRFISIQYNKLYLKSERINIITQALMSFKIWHKNMHIQTIKQNMHTIFVKKKKKKKYITTVNLKFSMEFKTKLKTQQLYKHNLKAHISIGNMRL